MGEGSLRAAPDLLHLQAGYMGTYFSEMGTDLLFCTTGDHPRLLHTHDGPRCVGARCAVQPSPSVLPARRCTLCAAPQSTPIVPAARMPHLSRRLAGIPIAATDHAIKNACLQCVCSHLPCVQCVQTIVRACVSLPEHMCIPE